MRIKDEIATLKSVDMWSIVLFSLYKIRGIPEFSGISELAYVLDKENLINLCEYFGGMTLKIPTIDEIESMVYALVLYQYVNIDRVDYDEAVRLIGVESSDLRDLKSNYIKICDVLKNYSFTPRESDSK